MQFGSGLDVARHVFGSGEDSLAAVNPTVLEVTSMGSLPPKSLGKSHRPPQSSAKPSERPRGPLGETPQSPLRDPRRAL